jgi:phenylpropionate dioxygenase-like ring-hydroxylating dioxygenase large terminal subunit
MDGSTFSDIGELVREDRIHQSVYTDPRIFDLERERIFRRVWLFIGHESQVKKPGDFMTLELLGQPLVMARHRDDKIHVLFNRCGHRGAKVVNEPSGNVRTFACCYHGWTFNTDGSLAGVPQKEDFPANLDFDDPNLGMVSLPRVDSYRGFVFASFAEEGCSLMEWLGPATRGIDELIACSPDEQLDFAGGCHRYVYEGNWKHQFENLADTYHPNAAHLSTVEPDGMQFKRRPGSTGGRAPFYDKNGLPLVSQIGVWAFPNGHTSEGSMFSSVPQSGGIFDEYESLLSAKHGIERARDILTQKRHSLTIFPSVDILLAQHSVRVVRPISVDRTEVFVYPVRMVGAPNVVFQEVIKYVNITHSAASFVQTDDLESFERCQSGMQAEGNPWCLVARGLNEDVIDNDGVKHGDRGSEIGQRNQHSVWLSLMSQP